MTQGINLHFFVRNRNNILYGIVLAILVTILKWLQVKYIFFNTSVEFYIGAIALIFTGLGIWVASKLMRPKVKIETVIIEKEVLISPQSTFVINEKQLEKTGLSSRELEVLQLMAQGLSNQEIADKMFVSLNTIKTHSSNIYLKLDVSRRTQAVDKAKKLNLIP